MERITNLQQSIISSTPINAAALNHSDWRPSVDNAEGNT